MTAHPELEELAAYAAGDLDAGVAAVVREHVSTCGDCLADLAALTQAASDVAAVRTVAMPDDVVRRLDAVLAAAREGTGGDVLPMRPSRRSGVRARLAGLAAGSAAAALVGVVALSTFTSRGDDRSPTVGRRDRESAAVADDRAAYTVLATDTNYSFDTVDKQVAQLVAANETTGAAPQHAPAEAVGPGEAEGGGSGGADADFSAAPRDAAVLAPPDQLARCVALLVEQADAGDPLLVDRGSYEGSAAFVVVLSGSKPDQLSVWFLDAVRCGTPDAKDDVGLLYQKNVEV